MNTIPADTLKTGDTLVIEWDGATTPIAQESPDGGSICFSSGDVPPWEWAPTPDTDHPVIMGFGLPPEHPSPEPRLAFGVTVDWPHVEAVRLEGGHLYLRGETVAYDPELFGAVRAWLVKCSTSQYPGWRPERLRYTTGAGAPPDGRPGAIRFGAHHGAPDVLLDIDGAMVGDREATPAEVHTALRAWFLGTPWADTREG